MSLKKGFFGNDFGGFVLPFKEGSIGHFFIIFFYRFGCFYGLTRDGLLTFIRFGREGPPFTGCVIWVLGDVLSWFWWSYGGSGGFWRGVLVANLAGH